MQHHHALSMCACIRHICWMTTPVNVAVAQNHLPQNIWWLKTQKWTCSSLLVPGFDHNMPQPWVYLKIPLNPMVHHCSILFLVAIDCPFSHLFSTPAGVMLLPPSSLQQCLAPCPVVRCAPRGSRRRHRRPRRHRCRDRSLAVVIHRWHNS